MAASLAAAPASAQALTEGRFASVMDQVFGRGAWRMTGGYRTPEREDELRAQGAMTVRPGRLSRHSLGRPGAPGAFDLVVDGMSPFEAAERLRSAGAPFARYQPKGAHGTQGPHLHLEPYGFGPAPSGLAQVQTAALTPDKGPPGRPRAAVLMMPGGGARSLAAAREDLIRIRAAATAGSPEAQLELGRALAIGALAPRDLDAAQDWLAAAVRNPAVSPEMRDEAIATWDQVEEMRQADMARVVAVRTAASDR